jgi:hypothetical protein
MNFLFEIGLAWNIQPERAHRHHPPPVARQRPRQLDRVIRARIGAYQHRIEAAPVREGRPRRFCLRPDHCFCPLAFGQRHPLRIEVHAEYLAARRPGNAHRQQAQQPQPDDRHPLPQLRLRQSEAVQRNRAQRGESGCLEGHLRRQLCQQVARHDGILGMHRIPAPGARHPVAHLEALQPGPHRRDGPRGRIAQRHRLVELIEGRLDRGQQPFPPRLIQHLAHQVWPRLGLAHQALLGEFDQRPLRARRHQRRRRPHQRRPRPGRRHRRLRHNRLSVTQIL